MEDRSGNMGERREPARQNLPALALEQLRRQDLVAEQVRRIAVGRQGLVHVEIEDTGRHRFFVYQDNTLRELDALNDRKLPLSKKLRRGDVPTHRLISYRPGRRIVVETCDEKRGEVFKGYKKHGAEQAVEKHRTAQAACTAEGFAVPELSCVDADHDCLGMVKVRGRTPEVTADDIGTWAIIGSCLRRFQQFGADSGMEVFDAWSELQVLDERARRYRSYVSNLPNRWEKGYRRLCVAASGLQRVARVLAHRDLHDKQFIVANDGVTLLDFDLLCTADVALDAGNLLAHLQLRELQREQGNALACQEAFLQGLGRQAEPAFMQALHYYQATTYYRLALLYALRPRWAHLVDKLIDLGQACLDMHERLSDEL